MSTSVSPSLNGRVKKSLEFQLNRLDTILDGLADALNGAVADAVKKAVEPAAREAVRLALEEAMTQLPKQEPARPGPLASFWSKAKAKITSWVSTAKSHLSTSYGHFKKHGTRAASAAALALQTGLSTVRSRAMRVGLFLGAAASCAISLFRKDAKRVWWGAGIVISTMVMESYFGTLGTLLLGGGVAYLMMLHGTIGYSLPSGMAHAR
jgi:hypothetical protein